MLNLYHLDGCPYCEKVRFALDHLGIEWQGVRVDPKDRKEVERVSGQSLVPVLDDDGVAVADSTRILEHLADHHDSTLRPRSDRDQGLASIVEDWADEVLAAAVRSYRKTSTEESRERLDVHLQSLDGCLHDVSYLVGDMLSAADISVYAFLFTLGDERREPLLEPYVNLREWYLNMQDYRDKSRRARGAAGLTDADYS